MPRFVYTAIDRAGTEAAGEIDADTREVAAGRLKARGYFPTDILPLASGTARVRERDSPFWRLTFSRSMGDAELTLFTRQLATLVHAGMPLLRGLEVLARQERNPAFRGLLDELAGGIRAGGALSDALSRHPRVFDRLYVNIVKAGEAGGVLDAVLERLAGYQEKNRRLRAKLWSAMVYPLVVLGTAGLILTGLLVFVVPRFKLIFADLLKGAPLPPLTQAVLDLSDAVRHHSFVVLAAGVALWVGFTLFRRTARGRRGLDTVLITLPLSGELLLQAVIARFSRTFGALLASGVPILQALVIARDTCGNTRMVEALDFVHERVKQGDAVAHSLAAQRIFPDMVTSLIEVGEHTGQLPEMLRKIADIYDEEVDTTVAGLSTLIEPLLIVLLALVVGTIVIALFLPIIRIVQLLT